MRSVIVIAALFVLAAPAYADAVEGGSIWEMWFGDPLVEIVLALIVGGYLIGLAGMRRDVGSTSAGDRKLAAAFFSGVAVVALALFSPLDALGERFFAAHMFQHLLLIIGAAPLFAFSNAHVVLAESIPDDTRRGFERASLAAAIAHWSQRPIAAWTAGAAFVVTIWFWHIPAAHDWATDDAFAHAAEHLTVLATAILFWRVVLTSGHRRIGAGAAALLVSFVGLSGALLSALIMFAPQPICRAYVNNPIEDQVLAGLLMCIPASFVYLGSTIWALWRLIGGEQSHAG
jgi:putative membrane protein